MKSKRIVAAAIAMLALAGSAGALAQVPPLNLPPADGYKAIPNFTGTNAGLEFRGAVNDRFSGIEAISPRLVKVPFAEFPAAKDGLLLYCADCKPTTPCQGGGPGAWAFVQNSQWTCEPNLASTNSLSAFGTVPTLAGFQSANDGVINPMANLNLLCTGSAAPYPFCTGPQSGSFTPAAGDGTTDDSAAISSALQIAAGRRLILPAYGPNGATHFLVSHPINGTNLPTLGVIIEGASNCAEGTTVGNQPGDILANTGGVVWDFTGSNNIKVRDVCVTDAPAQVTNPSTVGMLFARSTAGGATFDSIEDSQISLTRAAGTANGGVGAIGIYNYAAEVWHGYHVQLQAAVPFFLTDHNSVGLTSNYASIVTGDQSTTVIGFSGASFFDTTRGLGTILESDRFPSTPNSIYDLDMGDTYMNITAPGGAAINNRADIVNFHWHGRVESYNISTAVGNQGNAIIANNGLIAFGSFTIENSVCAGCLANGTIALGPSVAGAFNAPVLLSMVGECTGGCSISQLAGGGSIDNDYLVGFNTTITQGGASGNFLVSGTQTLICPGCAGNVVNNTNTNTLSVYHLNAATLQTAGVIRIDNAGNAILTSISNACSGTATLNAGSPSTATVSNSCITASCHPFCTDESSPSAIRCVPGSGSLALTGPNGAADAVSWGCM
jgi:hypothetical protein